ncbi:MAG: cytochrome C [Cellulophaga sp.]
MRSNIYIVGYALFFVLVFFSCKDHGPEYHTIMDKIEAESKNYHGVSVSSENYLGDIKLMEITEGDDTFLIPERKSQIKSFNCTECHLRPLKTLKMDGTVKKAHWDITLVHANENTLNCITCHDGSSMDNLKSLTGNAIDFNNSYNLCSQCHTKQFDDWKGGAHGKRIGGWAPPRAAMTCVNCHDPHDPHIASKWPVRYNSQKAIERK